MRICVIGTGYVGLVCGACFAETGQSVVCVDTDLEKLAVLASGNVPFYEPGLQAIVERNTAQGRLEFSSDLPSALADATAIFLAVGTPPKADGAADLTAVEAVARLVAEHVTRECVLIMKSTVPVGTSSKVRGLVTGAPYPVHVLSNPEFLREGSAVQDFLRPDRIVVGCCPDDGFARDVMTRLYHPVCLNQDHMLWMTPESSELTKYVQNSMLAMRISFMNEVARLCEAVGADVHEVRHGVGSDPRIGPKFLYAGPGYGGSCLPKDVKALVATARQHGVELELAAATDRVNAKQKGRLFEKLSAHFPGGLAGARIGIWGLAFKPKTDDIRESAALDLVDAVLTAGASVVAHDPEAAANVRGRYGDRITIMGDAYDAAAGADALVLVTEWRQYQNPDFRRLRQILKRPLLLDGRNIWSEYGLRGFGFTYEGVGVRGT